MLIKVEFVEVYTHTEGLCLDSRVAKTWTRITYCQQEILNLTLWQFI